MTPKNILSPYSFYQATGGASLSKALFDLAEGLRRAPLWLSMSWQDIKLRYRGSMLGPFWLSISMGIMVLALGFVYGSLFKMQLQDYMPYLVSGLMVWQYISVMMTEACTCFSQSEHFIKKIRQPYSVYIYRAVSRNLIIFAHNFVIYFIVAFLYNLWPGANFLLLIPGLLLVILNSVWLCLFLGLLCARFRDITQMVSSLVQITFLVTPIIWRADLLQTRGYLVGFNPFYYFVEIIRAPLLGQIPGLLNYEVAIGITLLGWVLSLLFFQRFRARLAYWV